MNGGLPLYANRGAALIFIIRGVYMQFPKWSDISKYRNELFGLSIISIIIFHYFEEVNVAGNAGGLLSILTKLYYAALGSVGVDVFLFLVHFD